MEKDRIFMKLESKTIIHMNTQLFYSYIIINCIEKREKKIKVKIIECVAFSYPLE